MSGRRRATRVLVLLRHWVLWVAQAEDRRQALDDLRRWIATTFLRSDLAAADLPWLTFPATRWLEARCRPGDRVFEWGSGASTLFFVRRGCFVLSIEHDEDWFRRLGEVVGDDPRVERRLVPPDVSPDPGNPDGSAAGAFGRYVAAIDDQPDGSMDLVLVDGRARVDCALRAVPKLRREGALILDDTDRQIYRSVGQQLQELGWTTIRFGSPRPACLWPAFSSTTVFIRRP